MAINAPAHAQSMLLDKKLLQKKIRELNGGMGLTSNPTATGEAAQELMLAQGIRPEENILSGELLRMRYGEDYEPDKDETA